MNNKEIKISPIQFLFLALTLVFRDFHIMNPSRFAKQDAWIAFLMGMFLGLIMISIYLLIAKLHPGKNLVEILLDSFGKYIGFVFSIIYIWFFIHLSTLILRAFSEYMVIINYFETPQYFIIITLMLALIYILRRGFEVLARISELFVPILILFVLLLFFILTNKFNYNFLLPILKDGVISIMDTIFMISNFPFGGLIILLMIFPYLNERNKMVKYTYWSVFIGSLLMLMIIFRDLLVLGPNILSNVVFPPNISTSLIQTTVLEPFISMNLLITVAGFLSLSIHSTIVAIGTLFKLEEEKPLIIPVVLIIIGISLWQFDNISEIFSFLTEVYPYYSFAFQGIIPLLILIISYIKRKSQRGFN